MESRENSAEQPDFMSAASRFSQTGQALSDVLNSGEFLLLKKPGWSRLIYTAFVALVVRPWSNCPAGVSLIRSFGTCLPLRLSTG